MNRAPLATANAATSRLPVMKPVVTVLASKTAPLKRKAEEQVEPAPTKTTRPIAKAAPKKAYVSLCYYGE